jgi:glycosyltransferase involved in cell wall biosynthesis
MEATELSIIIPFYKGDKFINRLLGSLAESRKALGTAGLFPLEVLLIVDSPEQTNMESLRVLIAPYIEPLSIQLLANERNMGVAATRNRGIEMSRGRYIYCVDQDDGVSTEFFQRIRKSMHENADFILLNGMVYYTETKFNPHLYFYLTPRLELKHLILDDIIRSPGQVILRKAALGDLRFPVTKSSFGSDDKFLWIFFFLKNKDLKYVYLKEPLYVAYIHGSNYSNDRVELQLASMESWKVMMEQYDASRIEHLIQRNMNYLKFVTRKVTHPSMPEKILGFYEWSLYFLRPNKLIRYFRKRVV